MEHMIASAAFLFGVAVFVSGVFLGLIAWENLSEVLHGDDSKARIGICQLLLATALVWAVIAFAHKAHVEGEQRSQIWHCQAPNS